EPSDPAGREARGERKGRHRGPLAGAAAAAPRAAGRRRGGRTQRAGAADPRRHRPRGAARRRRHPPGRGAAGRGARDPPRTRAARSGPPAPRQALLPARRLKPMAKNLVIVESPANARTLGKYLGRNYQAKASIRHVMDPPKSKLGVDIERDFAPAYHVIQGKPKALEEIKKAAKDEENVYLAPDPDREIRAFTPEEYWTVEARLEAGEPPPFAARLAEVGGQKLDHKSFRVDTKARVDEVLAGLAGAVWTVTKVERKERRRHPTPPFITSRLQQEASRKLGFQPSRTMRVAQRLYEGIELGPEGSVGLITYMRTDS